ncbi:MAG TPA: hypothetical protein GX507_03285, partial [Clostridia bacterium]|nr:hypothetical protein [Clostridia bacterium]
MAFVKWDTHVEDLNRRPETLTHLPSNAVAWTHPVTKTAYYLDVEQAAQINEAGLALARWLLGTPLSVGLLHDFLRKRDPQSRRALLTRLQKQAGFMESSMPSDQLGLACFWPDLPCPPGPVRSRQRTMKPGWLRGEDRPCWRLADFLLLRTGLLFAICEGRVAPNEWLPLRISSLLDGGDAYLCERPSWLPSPPSDKTGIFTVASALAGYNEDMEDLPADLRILGNTRVDLVQGGAFKIKEYYLETNRIGEIRGASMLLDDINTRRYFRLFEEKGLTPEGIVFAGGGHLLAIVPRGRGKDIASEIERIHREVCLTARAVGVALTCGVDDLVANFRQWQDQTDREIQERRSVLVPAWEATKGEPSFLAGDGFWKKIEPEAMPSAGAQEMTCHSCGVRPAYRIWQYKDDKRALCTSCFRKQAIGQSRACWSIDAAYDEFCHAYGIQPRALSQAKEIEDIADNRDEIAVIYGDGNDFGRLFRECSDVGHLRQLSQFCEGA